MTIYPLRPRLQRMLAAAVFLMLTAAPSFQAQTRFVVDPETSLAWWQVNPHLNHLWATTCPEEPTWRPGEGRSAGWTVGSIRPPKQGYAAVSDTTHVPLYPRFEALPLCTEAVRGEVIVSDTSGWSGVRGVIIVRAEALITGDERRDAYTRQAILETNRHREIRFTIDSVVDISQQGDTLKGTAFGIFNLRAVQRPHRAVVKAWPEAGGLRVTGKFRIPADELVPVYGLSSFALGLGVGTKIWQDLFVGVDLVVRPEEGAPAGG